MIKAMIPTQRKVDGAKYFPRLKGTIAAVSKSKEPASAVAPKKMPMLSRKNVGLESGVNDSAPVKKPSPLKKMDAAIKSSNEVSGLNYLKAKGGDYPRRFNSRKVG